MFRRRAGTDQERPAQQACSAQTRRGKVASSVAAPHCVILFSLALTLSLHTPSFNPSALDLPQLAPGASGTQELQCLACRSWAHPAQASYSDAARLCLPAAATAGPGPAADGGAAPVAAWLGQATLSVSPPPPAPCRKPSLKTCPRVAAPPSTACPMTCWPGAWTRCLQRTGGAEGTAGSLPPWY